MLQLIIIQEEHDVYKSITGSNKKSKAWWFVGESRPEISDDKMLITVKKRRGVNKVWESWEGGWLEFHDDTRIPMGEGVVKLLFPSLLRWSGNLAETDTYSVGNGKFRDHASREMADKGERSFTCARGLGSLKVYVLGSLILCVSTNCIKQSHCRVFVLRIRTRFRLLEV